MAYKKELQKRILKVFNQVKKETGNVMVKPRDFWKSQVPEDAPMHDNFEWDDSIGGAKYRDQQARQYIGMASFETVKGEVRYIENCIFPVDKDGEEVRGYVTYQDIMSDEGLKHQVLKNVLQELRGIEAKASKYSEIYRLINRDAMNDLENEINQYNMATV